MTAGRTFAVVGLGLAIFGAVGTAVVRIVAPAPFIGGLGFSGAAMVGYVIEGLSWASIGALLVVRRPENAVGWLMVPVGVGYALSQLSVALTSPSPPKAPPAASTSPRSPAGSPSCCN
jgi:hypothetical protein